MCKHCKPLDICNGDCKCEIQGIEVSQDDDIRFYSEADQPCEKFEEGCVMAKNYAVCPTEDLRRLCIWEDWFTAGTNSQYDKLFELNRESISVSEIALAIWLCTDGVSRGDIYDKLLDAADAYHKRMDT